MLTLEALGRHDVIRGFVRSPAPPSPIKSHYLVNVLEQLLLEQIKQSQALLLDGWLKALDAALWLL